MKDAYGGLCASADLHYFACYVKALHLQGKARRFDYVKKLFELNLIKNTIQARLANNTHACVMEMSSS